MTELSLTKTGFTGGVWQGELRGTSQGAGLKVWRDGKRVDGLSVAAGATSDVWDVAFSVPAEALGDASAVFLFRFQGQVEPLETLTLLSGAALCGDPRAELAALRAEVDLLKTVLRRGLGATDQSASPDAPPDAFDDE